MNAELKNRLEKGTRRLNIVSGGNRTRAYLEIGNVQLPVLSSKWAEQSPLYAWLSKDVLVCPCICSVIS